MSALLNNVEHAQKLSFKLLNAAAPGAHELRFSSRQNHSHVQENQLEFVRRHKIITGPWISDAATVSVFQSQPKEEFLTYMSGRVSKDAKHQIRHFLDMFNGEVGIVPSSEGLKTGCHALVVRLTGPAIAGAAPGLLAQRNSDGKHTRIALAEDLPSGEPFYCLYRHVEVLGELEDDAVRSWAAAQIAPEGHPAFFTRNPWILHVAGSKSFNIVTKLWLAPEEPVAAPIIIRRLPVPAPADEMEAALRAAEIKFFGAVQTGGLLQRATAVQKAKADVRAALGI